MGEYRHERLHKAEVFDLVSGWAKEWWPLDGAGAVINGDVLPDDGIVTYLGGAPVVASFLYDFPATAASLHAYLISDPQLVPEVRRAAVEAHVPAVVARSEALGNNYQLWLCDHPSLTATLEKDHGFMQSFPHLSAMYRASSGAPRLAALEA